MKLVRAVALLVAAAVLLVGAAPAWAEEGDPRARAVAHHQRGIELFQGGDPAAAAREFEAAQELAPAPSNLFNLARCYEALGDLSRAITTLEEYVAGELPEERRLRGLAELERLGALAAAGEAAPEPPAGEGTEEPTGAEPQPEGDGGAGEGAGEGAGAGEGGAADGSEPGERRFAWTGAIQMNAGAAFALGGDYQSVAPLLGVDLIVGFRLGRPRDVRGIETWPLRLEFLGGAVVQPGGDGTLLEVEVGGRLSVGIGHLPIRIEGELALGLTAAWVDVESGGPQLGLMVVPALGLAYQIRRWVEVVFRPARFELLGLAGSYPGGFQMRWGLDAQVRFRI